MGRLLWLTHEAVSPPQERPVCKDLDEDCPSCEHAKCWLYAPKRGFCPWLRSGLDQSDVHPDEGAVR